MWPNYRQITKKKSDIRNSSVSNPVKRNFMGETIIIFHFN